jgi:hypothetical protein
MPVLREFDHDMIRAYLKSHDLHFLRDEEDDFVVPFGHSEDWGCSLHLLLTATGAQNDVYCILVQSDKEIPRSRWPEAMMLCNEWNMAKHWPKAYLAVQDWDEDTEGFIVLEDSLDMEPLIHQEFFDQHTRGVVAAAIAFWQWAHIEKGF